MGPSRGDHLTTSAYWLMVYNRAMSVHGLFAESDEIHEIQTGLGLDDGAGLRVVNARFLNEQKFNWDLFDGYGSMRVLTYSASISAIIRMLDKYSFTEFECVFGYEGTLHDIKNILAFQKVVVGDTRAAIMGLKDERHIHVLEQVHAGRARFHVLRKHVAHAKLISAIKPRWTHTCNHRLRQPVRARLFWEAGRDAGQI